MCPQHQGPLCQRFSSPPGYLGPGSPLELLDFIPQAELSPPSIQNKSDKLTDLSQNPSRRGQALDVGCCFLISQFCSFQQLPLPRHGPACPAHLIPALVTLQQPRGVPSSHSQESSSGCQAPVSAGRESLSWGGLSGHCPEPQPSFQSCFPELCWRCWAPGDPSDSGQSRVCQDSGILPLRNKQNPAVLVPREMPCV